MTNYLLTIRFLAVFSCVVLLSSCEKDASDNAAPQPRVTPQKTFVFAPGELNPIKVGETWLQEPHVTGLSCDLLMTMTSHKVTPNAEIDQWVGTLTGSCIPIEKLVFNQNFTGVHGGNSYVYKIHTVANTDGSVTMTTNWNQKTTRGD